MEYQSLTKLLPIFLFKEQADNEHNNNKNYSTILSIIWSLLIRIRCILETNIISIISILSYAYHHLHLIQPLINIMLYISTTFCYEINANCIEKRNNVVIKPPVVSMLQMYRIGIGNTSELRNVSLFTELEIVHISNQYANSFKNILYKSRTKGCLVA